MFKIFSKSSNRNRDSHDLNLSSGERYFTTNWLRCQEIEKEINTEIGNRLQMGPDKALDDMKKDIPRCGYVIEESGLCAKNFDDLIDISQKSKHSRWVSENIVALSFCHQGLNQIIINNLGITYRGHGISSIGFSCGDFVNGELKNPPLIRYSFSNSSNNEAEQYFITLIADAKMSSLSTSNDSFITDREKSKIYYRLQMRFIPEEINKSPPRIEIDMDDDQSIYRFICTEATED